jgi:uncharacterized alkaline shock family protein YloU
MNAPASNVTVSPVGAGPDEGGRIPAEERGRLDISPVVIERIAEIAAAEISHVLAHRGRGLGRSERGVRAKADVDGRVARIRMGLALQYPVAVPEVCEQVRERVIRRLQEFAQVGVSRCDIQITELRAERAERRVQ